MDKRKQILNRNMIWGGIVTAAVWLLILLMGPLDYFTHGFYCDVVGIENIDTEDILGSIELGSTYEGKYVPAKKHFRGFQIILSNVPASGSLDICIFDENGQCKGESNVDLSQVTEKSWYRVYIDAHLKPGKTYSYTLQAVDCETAPCVQIVAGDYLGEEIIEESDILMGYVYADPTFSLPEKILLACLLIGIWLVLIGKLLCTGKCFEIMKWCSAFLIMTTALSWNFLYNSFDNQNEKFSQVASEYLVKGVINAERNGVTISRYGLGRYEDSKYKQTYLNDDNWRYGYSKTEAKILISNREVTQKNSIPGNYIKFSNGDSFQITAQEKSGNYLIISLDANKPLNYYKYGELSAAEFYDENGDRLQPGTLVEYRSQFGLQGKVFRHLARHIQEEHTVLYLNFLCSIAAAVTFSLIVFLIYRKYNILMAGCFYVTFLLSPWITSFARDLYWVEFTWFFPMLAGLFCALYIKYKWCRVLSYVAAFLCIMVKSLCGYEYISVVMMGLLPFLIVDFVNVLIKRDRKQMVLLFRTIIIIGGAALLGFMVAVCIHANIRGNGNLYEGIRSILEEDVLRRTIGGDLNQFDEVYWPSLNASVWEVFCIYFHFPTEIIYGIKSNLFPMLCLIPLAIFCWNIKSKRLHVDEMVLYSIFFLTSISWFVLGKSHSYIHTHMNYVMWYFGYIQICIYIICRQFRDFVKGGSLEG